MIKGLYSVKDELKGFGAVIVSDNDPIAIRDFAYACNSNEIMKLNHKDYSLYKVGEYDTELGLIKTDGFPQLLVDCSSVIKKEVTA